MPGSNNAVTVLRFEGFSYCFFWETHVSADLRGNFPPEGCFRVSETSGESVKSTEELGELPDFSLDDLAAKLPAPLAGSSRQKRLLPLTDGSAANNDDKEKDDKEKDQEEAEAAKDDEAEANKETEDEEVANASGVPLRGTASSPKEAAGKRKRRKGGDVPLSEALQTASLGHLRKFKKQMSTEQLSAATAVSDQLASWKKGSTSIQSVISALKEFLPLIEEEMPASETPADWFLTLSEVSRMKPPDVIVCMCLILKCC